MKAIRDFLREADAKWIPVAAPKLALRVLGSSALMLQTSYERGTKDSDLLETASLDETTRAALLALAGPNTSMHARHRLYVDIVPPGLPLLAQVPIWHPASDLNASLRSFDIELLDIVDVVVSKNDRSDIDAMIEGGHVTHETMLARFRNVIDFHSHDERLEAYVAHFHTVERDSFSVAETVIELPEWI